MVCYPHLLPLVFGDGQFDIFTSSVSLHLVGLGRYGDELNPNTLIGFIMELDRVMKKRVRFDFFYFVWEELFGF